MLSGFFQNQASTSGTRSGVAYKGPSIPTNPSPKKVVERETEETTDKEQSNFQGSTAHIPPSVNPIPILKPDVPKTFPKPNIPYPLLCEEYAPELLGFCNSSGGSPTPTSESFTSEFILEEIEAYLKDDAISSEIDHADCNPEEDISLIEKLLNNDPFQLSPMDLTQSEIFN
ncbi:hypothetical protein Tco_1551999 [Tanacetum coccineum]